FSSRRRHTSFSRDWSSDVCSSDLWFLQHIAIGSSSQDVVARPDLCDCRIRHFLRVPSAATQTVPRPNSLLISSITAMSLVDRMGCPELNISCWRFSLEIKSSKPTPDFKNAKPSLKSLATAY